MDAASIEENEAGEFRNYRFTPARPRRSSSASYFTQRLNVMPVR
jgi:hypothetical protein